MGTMVNILKNDFLLWLRYFSIFSVGLFCGEYLIDLLLSLSRESLQREIIKTMFIAAIMALGFLFLKKRNPK